MKLDYQLTRNLRSKRALNSAIRLLDADNYPYEIRRSAYGYLAVYTEGRYVVRSVKY